MSEDGIDISHDTSNTVNEYINIPFHYMITVCENANERCPFFPVHAGKIFISLQYNFLDPVKPTENEEEIMHQFQVTRKIIKDYRKNFVLENLK
jgi:arsenate reductase